MIFFEYFFSYIKIRSLKQKGDMQDMKIRELQRNIEEANRLAGDESSKHREAKEFIKSMTEEVF